MGPMRRQENCKERRLSFNPAQDASDWRCSRGVQEDEDGVPRCLGNDEAETFPVNLDVSVPADTKREDGLHASEKEKDAEEPGGIASGGPKKADDDRRTRNPGVLEEAADPEKKERTGDTLRDRHVPGGAWLTKVADFLDGVSKDLWTKAEAFKSVITLEEVCDTLKSLVPGKTAGRDIILSGGE
ncbi:hypothetical protein NDU88_001789 [Pleurodeles waltl]|uniref:Uncharacterized protein n=1 Tax=Pleurodeles waltl TaxID=8319 RepID=A0AAV7NBS3_PLEWA|nr:hypothetical protein NDU88_001789 [Pleurodeles waltl]